jgi:hypothetical protein
MSPRITAFLALACAAAAGWITVQAHGVTGPDAGSPVLVGKVKIAAHGLEAAAAKAARKHPARLTAALQAAANRAIERAWLEGEAARRGLEPLRDLEALRGEVADAVAGADRPPQAARLAAAFEDFHARWRAVTSCLPAYQDPYEDRCGNVAPAATGRCQWMGEATLCALDGKRWLVLRDGRRTGSFRSHGRALESVRSVYLEARAARVAAAAARRRAADRARAAKEAADREAEARAALAARRRDARLTGAALSAARGACARQVADSDPYMFGFGMQDTVGYAEGLIDVREAFIRRAGGAAGDAVDREKLAPLLAAVRAGNAELARLAAAEVRGNTAAVAAGVARFDARTEPERAISRRLGLGDCLARPAG